jgi:NADP-reducing hydrogenase subunit HndB
LSTPRQRLANLKEKGRPSPDDHYRIRVGMATCGLSAGAGAVYDAFGEALKEAGVTDAELIGTGCVGRCDLEPMAEVTRGNEPPVLYIGLDPEKARRIVREHIVGGSVVEEYTG